MRTQKEGRANVSQKICEKCPPKFNTVGVEVKGMMQ